MSAAPLPSADPLVALADRCVQCGLCLPACPTYGLDRLEAESPRGRIALARAWALDAIEATQAGDAHLDHCLDCRSCEAVCPAGVEYGALLVAAREGQRMRRAPGWRARTIERLVARPWLLAIVLRLYRLAYRWLPISWRPLPRPHRSPAQVHPVPSGTPQVAIFVGCIAGTYEASLRTALARCLSELGIAISEPAGQTCCGSLPAHGGNARLAEQLAARNRAAFTGADTVLTLASGCHEAVAKAVDQTGTRTTDAIAYLAERAASLRLRRCEERIALHLPCTQRNVVRSAPALRRLLAQVPGLTVIELDAGYGCCGAAGMQMIDDPARANRFREPLLQQLIQSKATRLLSANIGCRLHFAQATTVPVQHPIEFLAGLLQTEPPAPEPSPAALHRTA